MMMRIFGGVVCAVIVACGPTARNHGNDASGGGSGNGNGSGSGSGSGGMDYKVYAHADHVLYSIDLATQQLVTIGPFHAPQVMTGTSTSEDVITDLGVAPDGTIYVISETALYTASGQDGHVTQVGSLSTCGQKMVALTNTPDGKLYTGDYSGHICEIDIATSPPSVKPPVTMSGGLALSGDMVAINSGKVFGTAYKLTDRSGQGTQANNLLVEVDLATGTTTTIGSSGFPKLFGAAFQMGKVFGFTHDQSGRVVTIDTTTGVGSVFGTFMDPATHKGISFAGAGVNALVIE